MMEPSLSSELLTRTLNFHGQQLHKLWEAERGETYLPKLNVDTKALDFGVFQERQKHLSFQDRGKRLKLQQFIVKKASALYDTAIMEGHNDPRERSVADDAFYAVMPPYENFLELDKQSKTKHFFQVVKVGDIVMCSILSKTPAGMMLRVLCTDGDVPRHVADLNIKALCPLPNIIPAVDKKAVSRNYLNSDTVCCEVLEIYADTDKLVVGMKGTSLELGSIFKDRLGLIHSDDLPEVYKKAQEMKGESYEKILERSLGFSNPNNISYLSNILGLTQNHLTYVRSMRGRFPEPEYATELRHVQASKWAFKSVSDGIEHFKLGRHSEAFQCLNKALNIDPRNVEGLVARGALYANSGSFNKAIDDFENALKLNQGHLNARKYMGETLVALGRSFEDENKFEEAFKSYDKCLTVIPYHEEAQNSIDFLKSKLSKLSDVESVLPGLTPSKTLEVKETLKQLLKVEVEDEKKDKEKERSRSKKKKDRKSRKRRRRSSTSSSSSSSGSSHSSSESSSSSSDSSSGSSQHKKHRKSSRSKKDKSLSPLSKRMALMDPSRVDPEGLTGLLAQRMSHYNPPALPFAFTRSAASYPEPDNKAPETDDYEQRVFRFLEQTKGDSEYEEKVRKFLEESARWKKERKSVDEKSGKKKKKKDKKSREKDKGKKKKDHDKKKRHKNKRGDKFDVKDFEEQMESKKFRDALRKELGAKDDFKKRKGMDDEDEFLYGHGGDKKDLRLLGLDNLPDLDDLETKLSAYYAKVEKGTGLKGNEERHEKKRHAMSPGKGKHISPKVMFVHHDDEDDDDDDDEDDRVVHIRDKKKMDIFAESPSGVQDSKNKFGAAEAATMMNSKWKMQIGSVGSKLKKREKSKFDPEPWEDVDEKRFIFIKEDNSKPDSDEELQKRRKKLLEEKVQARKAALLEASEKRNLEKQKKEEKREEQAKKPQPFTDKFQGGFRSISAKLAEKKLEDLPPLPPGMPPKIQFPLRAKPTLGGDGGKGPRTDTDSDRSEVDKKKKLEEEKRRQLQAGRESGGSSRSRSRSRGKYSRHSSSSGSAARRRSRSGSYGRYSRSRSRSYGRYRSSSRSYRSRSRSYGSRSRSRSEEYRRRSRSPRYHAGKYQGRYPRARGTYYRPRFNTYKNPRGFQQRGGRGFRGGRRPFVHRGRGRGNYNNNNNHNNRGGRFFHYNNKPGGGYHDRRRHDRPRSRESRSYSREEDDPMRKVDAAKERIDKYLASSEEKKEEGGSGTAAAVAGGSGRKDDPLSEGEERDDEDYPPNYVDRKLFEGKWADKDAPPESSIEEIDKFLTKVKAQKKEEMKERNKSLLKTDPR